MKVRWLSFFAMMVAPILVLLTATSTSGQIPIRRASPVVKGPISVESTVIKSGDIPGIFYGTNKGFRYFFEIKNGGPKPFSGQVEIYLLTGNDGPGIAPTKTFDLIVPAGQTQTVSIDSQTGPAIGNSGLISGFRFVALSIAAEGSGRMAANYDTLP